jgi:hypothetical protein
VTAFFRARVSFITTAEGGRTDAIRFRSLDDEHYEAILDFGFGEMDDAVPSVP